MLYGYFLLQNWAKQFSSLMINWKSVGRSVSLSVIEFWSVITLAERSEIFTDSTTPNVASSSSSEPIGQQTLAKEMKLLHVFINDKWWTNGHGCTRVLGIVFRWKNEVYLWAPVLTPSCKRLGLLDPSKVQRPRRKRFYTQDSTFDLTNSAFTNFLDGRDGYYARALDQR